MKKLLTAMIAIVMSGFMMAAPVFAETEPCTCYNKDGIAIGTGTRPKTAILDNSACDCGHGESVVAILTLVLDILTGLIGIVAVIGITIVGIQYLTAGGSEEKTRKAKRRLFEIVLGVAAYVVIYVLLKWLLPGWNIG